MTKDLVRIGDTPQFWEWLFKNKKKSSHFPEVSCFSPQMSRVIGLDLSRMWFSAFHPARVEFERRFLNQIRSL